MFSSASCVASPSGPETWARNWKALLSSRPRKRISRVPAWCQGSASTRSSAVLDAVVAAISTPDGSTISSSSIWLGRATRTRSTPRSSALKSSSRRYVKRVSRPSTTRLGSIQPRTSEAGTWSVKSTIRLSKRGPMSSNWVSMLTRYCRRVRGSGTCSSVGLVCTGALQSLQVLPSFELRNCSPSAVPSGTWPLQRTEVKFLRSPGLPRSRGGETKLPAEATPLPST